MASIPLPPKLDYQDGPAMLAAKQHVEQRFVEINNAEVADENLMELIAKLYRIVEAHAIRDFGPE
jgi:hypothetical protein